MRDRERCERGQQQQQLEKRYSSSASHHNTRFPLKKKVSGKQEHRRSLEESETDEAESVEATR